MTTLPQYLSSGNGLPIKAWSDSIEPGCVQQAINLANLPFAFHHVALMPDTHQGYGMPIGGVLATRGAVVPNAVGVDIGCGMAFVPTNVPASLLREVSTPNGVLGQALVGAVMRNVPTGFGHHRDPQVCRSLDSFVNDHGTISPAKSPIWEEIESGYYQVGTLGGGNHFIEFQEDEQGNTCLMLHSGSRNFGYKICKYYNNLANDLCARWYQESFVKQELAFLPLEESVAQDYIRWMTLALNFAQENREMILHRTLEIFLNMVKKYTSVTNVEIGEQINAHHNYAAFEHHYGSNVLVHRKGAILAREGMLGIIPGAMGSYSYIVRGKGNKESFESASHGAGRTMGRKEAKRQFQVSQVMDSLREDGVILGKENKDDVAEECKNAYKDIDTVIANESDLVEPIRKLRTVCVIKG